MFLRHVSSYLALLITFVLFGAVSKAPGQTQPGDIVLYASQAPVKVGWTSVADSTAAGGIRLANSDLGAPKIVSAAASPARYVELTFTAEAGKAYRLWMRGKAHQDSPYNDSAFVQFSGSVNSSGSPVFRIGTTSATEYNLEDCFGCGIKGWGWQDNGWGVGVLGPQIFFQNSGSQTIRIQVREDGLSIDQIVLSPGTYFYSSPGSLRNDSVILPASSGTSSPSPTPTPTPAPSAADVVIWASDVPATSIFGGWTREYNSSAAGQLVIRHPDFGAAKIGTAHANPTNFFQVNFNAVVGQAYRLWIRGRADNNFWGNDSVFAQFSGSLNSSGSAAYRIGTTSALEINLENCSGCGLSGWGWQDTGWGAGVLGPVVYFQSTGTQTLRIQTREDGLSIDQIVLSPYNYLTTSPGALKNDTRILSSTISSVTNQPPQVVISASPLSGTSPLLVNFSSSASDPDGYISSYSWSFGDGKGSTASNPSNTYQSAGTYTARLTVTDNSGASASASLQISVSAPVSTTQLRVLSWNASFGQGTDGVSSYDRTAAWLANINADLIALCEIPQEKVSTVVNGLSQRTGRTWYSHFVQKYSGTSEGNLILSKYSFQSVSGRYLSYQRSVAQVRVSIGGRNINFFATHLDPNSSSVRYTQVGELMSWASGFAESRIVAGDFNGGPDTSEIIRMAGSYFDTWNEAMYGGTALSYPDNPVGIHTRTRRGRIDYVFFSRGTSNLLLRGTQVPDSRDLQNTNVVVTLGTLDDRGVRPSDHNHMLATFDVR